MAEVELIVERTDDGYSFKTPAEPAHCGVFAQYTWQPHYENGPPVFNMEGFPEFGEPIFRLPETYGGSFWLIKPFEGQIGVDEQPDSPYSGNDAHTVYIQRNPDHLEDINEDGGQGITESIAAGTEIILEYRTSGGLVLNSKNGGEDGWKLAKWTGSTNYTWVQSRDTAELVPYADWSTVTKLGPSFMLSAWVTEEEPVEPEPPTPVLATPEFGGPSARLLRRSFHFSRPS